MMGGSNTTISHDDENTGIIPRSIKFIVEELERKRTKFPTIKSEIRVTVQEIYMETVRDLINPANVLIQTN